MLPLSIAFATLPFYALMQMQDGIARSYNWIHVALLPPYVVRHLIMLTIVSAAYLLNFPTNAETAVTAVAVALVLTVIGQTFVLNRKLARAVAPGPKAYEVKTWLSVSLPILIVEGFYLLLTNVDIVMLQHFRSPDDVAVYYAAAKTLALIAFVHFAVSAAVGHRFSEYHVTNDHDRLKTILADSIRWTFWASLAASVVILAMGRPLLSLFGPRFVEGYHLMLILVAGLMARASVGPVERLLNMLGEQRVCAAVYADRLRAQPRPLHRADPAHRRRRRRHRDVDRADRRIRAAVLRHQAPARLPRLHLGPLLSADEPCTLRFAHHFKSSGAGLPRSNRSPRNGARSPHARSSPTCSTSPPSRWPRRRCSARTPAPCWCGPPAAGSPACFPARIARWRGGPIRWWSAGPIRSRRSAPRWSIATSRRP